MNETPHFGSAEIEADTAASEAAGHTSLVPYLDAALRYALADLAYTDDPSGFEALRRSVIESAVPSAFSKVFGATNAEETPGFTALTTLTDRVISTPDGPDVNPIWTHPGFVQPAIAALALLLERCLNPRGDSRMTLYLRPERESLYGYRLVDLRAWGISVGADRTVATGPLTAPEKRELIAHLTGAAYFFARGGFGVNIGSKYLRSLAGRAPAPGRTTPKSLPGLYTVLV